METSVTGGQEPTAGLLGKHVPLVTWAAESLRGKHLEGLGKEVMGPVQQIHMWAVLEHDAQPDRGTRQQEESPEE